MRMKIAGEQRLMPARHAIGHHHRFGSGGRAVIHRGIRHLHIGDERDLRLEFEEGLQRALRDLRLIRRVGSQELAALHEVVDRCRHMMAISTGTQEARHRVRGCVLGSQRRQLALDLDLAHAFRQIERRCEAEGSGYVVEKIVDAFGADHAEHRAAIFLRQRQVAH